MSWVRGNVENALLKWSSLKSLIVLALKIYITSCFQVELMLLVL